MQNKEVLEYETVDTPHFDDERTLLRARRVVPLAKLHRAVVTRRRLFLGCALLLAVSLGAITALLIVRIRQPGAVQAAASDNSADDQSTKQDVPVATAQVSAAAAQTNDAEKPQIANNDRKVTRRRSSHMRVAPKPVVPADVQSLFEDNKQPLLVDQWQERRLRRATRIERRRHNHGRDLFMIRDIFEGERPF